MSYAWLKGDGFGDGVAAGDGYSGYGCGDGGDRFLDAIGDGPSHGTGDGDGYGEGNYGVTGTGSVDAEVYEICVFPLTPIGLADIIRAQVLNELRVA